MRAKIIALGLAAACGLIACKPKMPPPAPPPAIPLSFSQTTPDAKVTLTLAPEIGAWPALHQKLYKDGTAELKRDLATAKTDRAHIADESLPNPAYEHQITWSVAARTPRLVSLKGTWMSYTGGAHPNSGFNTLIWDTNEGSEVSRMSLFKPAGPADATVQSALCDGIRQARIARGAPPDGDPKLWPCPKWRDSNFVLEPSNVPDKLGGVRFLFDPYAIGSYAEGAYEVTVYLAAIKDVLAPAYVGEFAGGPAHPADIRNVEPTAR